MTVMLVAMSNMQVPHHSHHPTRNVAAEAEVDHHLLPSHATSWSCCKCRPTWNTATATVHSTYFMILPATVLPANLYLSILP